MSDWDDLLSGGGWMKPAWSNSPEARGPLLGERARRLRLRVGRPKHVVVSAAMVLAGMCGLLAGAWFVGWWLFGLALMAESGAVAWVGLVRDDGSGRPVTGVPTVEDIHERERLRMTAEDRSWGE